MAPPRKTVFVFGAGFSAAAQFPLQTAILPRIREFQVDLLTSPRHTIDVFEPARKELLEFLERVFPAGSNPPLEDVFTLLDQAIAHRDSCGGYPWTKLVQIRESLSRAILFVFHQAGESLTDESRNAYRSIASYLIGLRAEAGQEGDPFSIVSLNWDYLLDDMIFECIDQAGLDTKVDIDYCCYTNPMGSSQHIPSLLQKTKGLFNIKILKLHGSANWLRCPNCNRLFTGVGAKEEVWDSYVLPHVCRYCTPGVPEEGGGDLTPLLEPFVISPTFVKVFDNPHIQMIWHNAYVDLAEAARLIFVGYSLPEADYHVRTLLRRAVRRDADVIAVLRKEDEPPADVEERLRNLYAAVRYSTFFGASRVHIDAGGVEAFFKGAVGDVALQDALDAAKGRIVGGP